MLCRYSRVSPGAVLLGARQLAQLQARALPRVAARFPTTAARFSTLAWRGTSPAAKVATKAVSTAMKSVVSNVTSTASVTAVASVAQEGAVQKYLANPWSLVVKVYGAVYGFLRDMAVGARDLYRDTWKALPLYPMTQRNEPLSRRELLLVTRNWSDLKRFIPFLVLINLPGSGVVAPILISKFPSILPSTFVSSVQRIEARNREWLARCNAADILIRLFKRQWQDPVAVVVEADEKTKLESVEFWKEAFSGPLTDFESLKSVPPEIMTGALRFHSLDSSFIPHRWRVQWLEARLRTMAKDDATLVTEGGAIALNQDEIMAACHKRGMYIESVPPKILAAALDAWLGASRHGSVSWPARLHLEARVSIVFARLQPALVVAPPPPPPTLPSEPRAAAPALPAPLHAPTPSAPSG